MKFLCLDCDEPMKLLQSEGPEDGSLAVTFRCPQCGFRVAMLTNQFETQLIRSLGVTMGSRVEPGRPFEHLRASMAHAAPMQTVDPTQTGGQTRTEQAASEGPGCPFAAMVNTHIEATSHIETTSPVHWTAEAEARIERIPPFVREMARRAIERFARGRGFTTITEPVVEQARDALGM